MSRGLRVGSKSVDEKREDCRHYRIENHPFESTNSSVRTGSG